VEPLHIIEGRDLCTLVTCTPYGVNSHRLLVRGHRVANPEEVVNLRVTADAYMIEPLMVAPVVAVPILVVMLWIIGIADRINRRKTSARKQEDIDE
jgi:sortase A